MSTKKSKPAPTALEKPKLRIHGRDELGVYIHSPETNPEGRIVSYDDDFVVIRDKYPKASVHLLLIPRAPERWFRHPLQELSNDAVFLADVRIRIARLKKLAAADLRRQFGHLSAADAPYQATLEDLMAAPDPPTEEQLAALPPGRDWEADIIAGVHTHPSMNHLHIHVISRDSHSECMKHKKHYLSFHTNFMVQMEEFPLQEGSKRFHPGNWPNWDMKCWRCGENFENKFKKLEDHLEGEFAEWVKE
ncbi:HIT-like protein [Ophiobolus disseminans]|uniref:Aprataxin-like protein n=1 Tax=Ophiobolus disseminans TaxID=1469910 RepID=A0A6A6ZXB2_9PLEO|nr:HIT-like protein [Ophiobolus disseminans]